MLFNYTKDFRQLLEKCIEKNNERKKNKMSESEKMPPRSLKGKIGNHICISWGPTQLLSLICEFPLGFLAASVKMEMWLFG